MNKIISIKDVGRISAQEKKLNKKIVLVGGCFDILHTGHITFLEKAAKEGNILFLLLESDENIKRRKGINRPINNQMTRANILSAFPYINYIVPLTGVTKDKEYDKLIVQIKPDTIVMTKGDSQKEKRQKQCEMAGAKLRFVDRILSPSTTDLISKIN